MKTPHSFNISGQQLWLTPLKAIYWENASALILSDLHFGKTGHFRKSGIGVPQEIFKQDLQRLFHLVQYYQPKELLIVGDFFHSSYNRESDWFARWRKDHASLECRLIRGNHDILKSNWYEEQEIEVIQGLYKRGPFGFIHDAADLEDLEADQLEEDTYIFTGHLHPGIRLSGSGKQSVRLPCYYFGKRQAILPAFSAFSGMALISPELDASIFAIAGQEIIALQ